MTARPEARGSLSPATLGVAAVREPWEPSPA